jgi:uncharacterized membrane protein YgaE (UPF0421/DUF939 family)
MNMKGINILFFIGGAAVGAVASYIFTKDKYAKDVDAQIDEIRDMYEKRVKNIENSRRELDKMNEKKAEMMRDLEEKVKKEEESVEMNTDYNSISKSKPKQNTKTIKIVTDAEAQNYTKNGLELIGLTLYSDDVLTDDETENIIEDYADWIGINGIEDIRESDTGEGVYILNEERKAVYDITVIDERFGDDDDPITIH